MLIKIYKWVNKILPQNFAITTNNGSANFNIDTLKHTSSTIFQLLQNRTDNLLYHLPVNLNALEKLEQLYQGKIVLIEKNEIQAFIVIIQSLQIRISYKRVVQYALTGVMDNKS